MAPDLTEASDLAAPSETDSPALDVKLDAAWATSPRAPPADVPNSSAEWPTFSAEFFAVVNDALTAVVAASVADATASPTLCTKPEKVVFININPGEE